MSAAHSSVSGADASSVPAPSDPEARLAASRLAMRTVMLPVTTGASAAVKPPSRVRATIARIPSVERVASHPVVSLLKDAVQTWWVTHPWRPFLAVGTVAAKQMIVPIARQHPGRLIGGAMLAGAVLSRWRPWKWLLVSVAPALVASMLPSLVSRIATRLPLATLLRMIGVSPSQAATAAADEAVVRRPVPAPLPPSGTTVSSADLRR